MLSISAWVKSKVILNLRILDDFSSSWHLFVIKLFVVWLENTVRKGECAAVTFLRDDTDLTLEAFTYLFADWKTYTIAVSIHPLAFNAVCLLERFEDPCLLFFWHADSLIIHNHLKHAWDSKHVDKNNVCSNSNDTLALELGGISEEVKQHLLKSSLIKLQRGLLECKLI